MMTQDEDKTPIKINQERGRRSLRLYTSLLSIKAPVRISLQVLCAYLGNAISDTAEWSISYKLGNKELPTSPQIDIEEYAKGVVNPVTK